MSASAFVTRIQGVVSHRRKCSCAHSSASEVRCDRVLVYTGQKEQRITVGRDEGYKETLFDKKYIKKAQLLRVYLPEKKS